MDAYPKLSDEAYSDETQHRKEVVEMAAEEACDVWRYYAGFTLTEEQQEAVRKAIDSVLPSSTKPPPSPPSPHAASRAHVLKPIERFPYAVPTGMLKHDHLNALRRFRDANGRTWKAKLNDHWQNACQDISDPDERALLQQVRNLIGPSGLARINLT